MYSYYHKDLFFYFVICRGWAKTFSTQRVTRFHRTSKLYIHSWSEKEFVLNSAPSKFKVKYSWPLATASLYPVGVDVVTENRKVGLLFSIKCLWWWGHVLSKLFTFSKIWIQSAILKDRTTLRSHFIGNVKWCVVVFFSDYSILKQINYCESQ